MGCFIAVLSIICVVETSHVGIRGGSGQYILHRCSVC